MFLSSNMDDRENLDLMVHIIAKCVVDYQKQAMKIRHPSEAEELNGMITIPAPAGYRDYDNRESGRSASEILTANGLLEAVHSLPSNFALTSRNTGPLDVSGLVSDTSSVSTEDNNNNYIRFAADNLDRFGVDVLELDNYVNSNSSTPVRYHNEDSVEASGVSTPSNGNIESDVSTPKIYRNSDGVECSDNPLASEDNSGLSTPKQYHAHTNTTSTILAVSDSLSQWKANRNILSDAEDEEDDPSKPNPDRDDPDAPWNIPKSPLDKAFRTGVGGIGRIPDVAHLVMEQIPEDEEDRDILQEMYLSTNGTSPRGSSPRGSNIVKGTKSLQSPMTYAMSRKIQPESLHAVLSSPTAAYMGYVPSSANSNDNSSDGLGTPGTPPTPVINPVKSIKNSLDRNGDLNSSDNLRVAEEENTEGNDYVTLDDIPANFGFNKTVGNSEYSINPNYSLNPNKGWYTVDENEDTVEPEGSEVESTGNDEPQRDVRSSVTWDQILSDHHEVDSQTDDFNKARDMSAYVYTASKYSNYDPFAGNVSPTPSTTSPSSSYVGSEQILIKDEKGRLARIVSPSSSIDQYEMGYSAYIGQSPRQPLGLRDSHEFNGSEDEFDNSHSAASAAYGLLHRSLLRAENRNTLAQPEIYNAFDHAAEAVFQVEGELSEGGNVDDDVSPESHPVVHMSYLEQPKFPPNSALHNSFKSSLQSIQEEYGAKPVKKSDTQNRRRRHKNSRSSLLTLSPAKLNLVPNRNKSNYQNSSNIRLCESTSPITSPNNSTGSGHLFQEFDDSDISSSESSSAASDALLDYGNSSEEDADNFEPPQPSDNGNDDYYRIRSNEIAQVNEVSVNIIDYDKDAETDDEESENDTEMATRDTDNQTAEYTIATVSDDVLSYGSSTRGLNVVNAAQQQLMDDDDDGENDEDEEEVSPSGERINAGVGMGNIQYAVRPGRGYEDEYEQVDPMDSSESDESDEDIEDQYVAPTHYDHYSHVELTSSPLNTSKDSMKHYAFRAELEDEYRLNLSMHEDRLPGSEFVDQYIAKLGKKGALKSTNKRKVNIRDSSAEKKVIDVKVRRARPAMRSLDTLDIPSSRGGGSNEADEEKKIMQDLYRKAAGNKEYNKLFGQQEVNRPKSALASSVEIVPIKRKTKRLSKSKSVDADDDHVDMELPVSNVSKATAVARIQSALESMERADRGTWAEIRVRCTHC